MIHLRYEFIDKAEMLEVLSAHFIKNEEGNCVFKDGTISEQGFKTSYDEDTEETTIVSGYRVDIIWKIEEVPEYSNVVTPGKPDHRFGGWN